MNPTPTSYLDVFEMVISSDVQQIGMSFTWKQVLWCGTILHGMTTNPGENIHSTRDIVLINNAAWILPLWDLGFQNAMYCVTHNLHHQNETNQEKTNML